MACRRAGFEPQVNHEVTDTAATLAMAAAGMGVAPVTDLMLQLRPRLLESVALVESIQRVMVLAHRQHPVLQPGLQSVIEAIQQTILNGVA
jgi:DNA-binding transcriptional LysR family regulator